jgi:hypothetical protein
MPKPTLTEMVRELDRSVVILEEQVKGIGELDEADRQLSAELGQLKITFAEDSGQLKLSFAQELAQLRAELATIREKAMANEKAIDQINQRRWTLVLAIVSAILCGFLTFIIQLSLRALPK